jgi:hypothetical protein
MLQHQPGPFCLLVAGHHHTPKNNATYKWIPNEPRVLISSRRVVEQDVAHLAALSCQYRVNVQQTPKDWHTLSLHEANSFAEELLHSVGPVTAAYGHMQYAVPAVWVPGFWGVAGGAVMGAVGGPHDIHTLTCPHVGSFPCQCEQSPIAGQGTDAHTFLGLPAFCHSSTTIAWTRRSDLHLNATKSQGSECRGQTVQPRRRRDNRLNLGCCRGYCCKAIGIPLCAWGLAHRCSFFRASSNWLGSTSPASWPPA